MLLRNFSASDMSGVMELVAASFTQDYPPSFYLSLSAYWHEGFLLAIDQGVMIGLIIGAVGSREEVRILMMTVREGWRGRGVGTALLHEFLARCRFKGANRVVLEVRVSNSNARSFYQGHGFRSTGVVNEYYMDGEACVKMTKWL